jgi:hypothetical protein
MTTRPNNKGYSGGEERAFDYAPWLNTAWARKRPVLRLRSHPAGSAEQNHPGR